MKSNWNPSIQKALDEERLLIITPFNNLVKRASATTAAIRNDLMLQLADEVVVGYSNPTGLLQERLNKEQKKLHFLS